MMNTTTAKKRPAGRYTVTVDRETLNRLKREIKARKSRRDGIRTIGDYLLVALRERLERDERTEQ